MYSATFTFAKGEYDDEFHRLDRAIAEVAKAILVVARLEDPNGVTSKKTAGFHKTVDPDKLRSVARCLFN